MLYSHSYKCFEKSSRSKLCFFEAASATDSHCKKKKGIIVISLVVLAGCGQFGEVSGYSFDYFLNVSQNIPIQTMIKTFDEKKLLVAIKIGASSPFLIGRHK